MMDIKKLAIELVRADNERAVIAILNQVGLWNAPENWRYFGDIENNYSTIGNQQSAPDAALVEKIVNSIDAVLTKYCLLNGIDPAGNDAPATIKEALISFFQIRDGDFSNMDTAKRNEMSKQIVLAATGTAQHPNYIIADMGEGQSPQNMPNTILSIGKSNKLKIPFVQGKYNMGGTGVFCFCSPDYNIQVLLSKRCPDIPYKQDDTHDNWGITVIRREAGIAGSKSSVFTYLTTNNGGILSFEAPSLPVIPTHSGSYTDFEYGMFIKLFDYNMAGYKTNILLDLNYRLALLMPNMAYPVRLIECRSYRGHSFEATLSGLDVRLKDDRNENIEPGFPDSFQFRVLDQEFSGSIFVFKKDANIKNYKKNEGVIFTVNGQTHADLKQSFIRKTGLSYIADSILVVVDCSKLETKPREDLFMNSRDRLRECDMKRAIEQALSVYIKEHPGLKELQSKRRQEALSSHLQNEKPFKEILTNILSKSPTLSQLFIVGDALKLPYNLQPTGNTNKYIGKKHPTFFSLKKKQEKGQIYRNAPQNHDFRIQFITDVENNYFNREAEPGGIEIICNNHLANNLKKSLGLFNGTATLTFSVPDDAKVNDQLDFEIRIVDDCILELDSEKFSVLITEAVDYPSNNNRGDRTPPSNDDTNGKNTAPKGLALPNTREIYRADWSNSNYNATKETALIVLEGDESTYDYYINMDNISLLNELKTTRDSERISIMKAQYKYSNVLIGMSVLNYYKREPNEDVDIEEQIRTISSVLSPILLPMINTLGNLSIDSVSFDVEEDAFVS